MRLLSGWKIEKRRLQVGHDGQTRLLRQLRTGTSRNRLNRTSRLGNPLQPANEDARKWLLTLTGLFLFLIPATDCFDPLFLNWPERESNPHTPYGISRIFKCLIERRPCCRTLLNAGRNDGFIAVLNRQAIWHFVRLCV